MQSVRFIIRRQELLNWNPVVEEIEKHGYKVECDIEPADITVVLSGTYLNPLVIPGKKILVAHQQEWGTLWGLVYKPVLEEYYDHILTIGTVPLDKIADKIRELIEIN